MTPERHAVLVQNLALARSKRKPRPKAAVYKKRNTPQHAAQQARVQEMQAQKQLERMRIAKGLPEPTRPAPPNCELCGLPFGEETPRLDHCHYTGEFRGWIHGNCNSGIGFLGNNAVGVAKALSYLMRFEKLDGGHISDDPVVNRILKELK